MKNRMITLVMMCCMMAIATTARAACVTSRQSGAWNSTQTWAGGQVPVATDCVTIASGHRVTGPSNSCMGLTLQANSELQVSGAAFTANGGVTVDATGTLSGTSTLVFNGATLTNNGVVSVANCKFNLPGDQTIAGTGTWTGTGTLTMAGSGTKLLANDVTFAIGTLTINSGVTFNLGDFTLTFNGGTLGGGAVTSSALGKLQTQGNVMLNTSSNFTASLLVASGRTMTNVRATLGGAVTVGAGAILHLIHFGASVTTTINGDVTVNANGTIDDDGGVTLAFNGTTFTNDGVVNLSICQFNLSGEQTIKGAGTLTVNNTLTMAGTAPSTKLLAGNTTFAGGTLTINSGVTFNLGDFTLTFNGGTLGGGAVTSSALGKLQTQGNVTLNTSSNFTAPLLVAGGTTASVHATLGGAVTVGAGATLKLIHFGSSVTTTINGDVTVNANGTITDDLASKLAINGATFTNDGLVTVSEVRFASGMHTLRGTGSFADNLASVPNGATVMLGSDHQLSRLKIDSGGAMNITNRRLRLSGSGTPLTNSGTFTTMSSTIAYNGASPQTVATTNIVYSSLSIDNSAGAALNAPIILPQTLRLISGVFNIGNQLLTLADGALISRSGGTLSAVPNFGATVNLQYAGSSPITTDLEMPTSTSVLNDLTINHPGGVTLNTNITVNGTLTLTHGDLKTGAFTLTMPASAASAGTMDVVGNLKRTGFVRGMPLSFGNPFNTIQFDAGTLPSDVTMNLVKTSPVGFSGAIKRTYTITPNGGSGYSATLRLHYRDEELNNNQRFILGLWRYDGLRWRPEFSTATDPNDNWVERRDVRTFSPWTIAEALERPPM
jgi:hypothetical protein